MKKNKWIELFFITPHNAPNWAKDKPNFLVVGGLGLFVCSLLSIIDFTGSIGTIPSLIFSLLFFILSCSCFFTFYKLLKKL
jgi:hypothetical protein